MRPDDLSSASHVRCWSLGSRWQAFETTPTSLMNLDRAMDGRVEKFPVEWIPRSGSHVRNGNHGVTCQVLGCGLTPSFARLLKISEYQVLMPQLSHHPLQTWQECQSTRGVPAFDVAQLAPIAPRSQVLVMIGDRHEAKCPRSEGVSDSIKKDAILATCAA